MSRNVTSLEIKLRDLVTPGLKSMMNATKKADDMFDKLGRHASRNTKKVGHSIDSLTRKIDELRQKKIHTIIDGPQAIRDIRQTERALHRLTRERDKLDRMGTGGRREGKGGGSRGVMLGNLKANAWMMAADAAARAGRAVLTGGARKEQNLTGLRTFVGNDAERVYGNIEQDAEDAPFDVESLVQVNRALISAGTNSKAARLDALALANAVSAVGGGNDVLSRMAANMQQIKTVGKATAIDIKQFGMAGINIHQLLANATGKSVDEVENMEVSYELLSQALRQARAEGGLYAGAMEAQAKTLSGRFSKFLGKLSKKAAEVGDKLTPVFNTILDGVTNLVDSPAFGIITSDLASVIGEALVVIFELIESLMPILEPALKLITAIAKSALSLLRLINPLIKGIVEFAAKILGPVLEKLKEAFAWIEDQFRWFANYLGIKGKEAGQKFSSNIKSTLETSNLPDWMKDIGRQWGEQAVWGIQQSLNSKALANLYDPFSMALKAVKGKTTATPSAGDLATPPMPKLGGTDSAPKSSLGKTNKAISNSITSGGTRTINVTIGKFQDNINITTNTFREGVDEMARAIQEEMLRIVHSATNMQ